MREGRAQTVEIHKQQSILNKVLKKVTRNPIKFLRGDFLVSENQNNEKSKTYSLEEKKKTTRDAE